MTRVALALVLVAACTDPPDAPAGFAVTVLAPNGGEALVAGEPAEVRWTRSRDAAGAPCDVELVDEAGAVTTLASGASGGAIAWTPPGVEAAGAFRVRVVARGDVEEARDESDAAFTIAPPAVGVSLARDVQPIFTRSCTTRFCHGHESQVALLDLSAGAARAALVEVPSATAACRAFVRVRAGKPEESYLLWKLAGGGGACLAGVRMPKDAPALPPAEVSLIRGWVAEGARAN